MDSEHGKYRYLAAFDFDSTLIEHEIIDEIAELAGMRPQVSKITKMVVNGELPLEDALYQRATLLEGVTYENLMMLGDRIKTMGNITQTMGFLKAHGFYIAVISAALNPVAARVASRREFSSVDQFLFNSLKMDNHRLTGDVDIKVVDKGVLVQKLQQELGIDKTHTISVGDSSADVPMFSQSGLSIAFNAKEIAKKAATKTVDGKDVAKIIPVVEDWLITKK